MSLSLRYLVDRLRHPRTRAEELARLRARFMAQPARWAVDRRAVALADELRDLRPAMLTAMGRVALCGQCAKGHPLPAGRWDGGHCCGAPTFNLFNPLEVAALKLGGSSPRRMHAPRGDHAGCAFRGPTGCSLEPVDRPTLCVRYVCVALRQEIIDAGRWPQVAPLNRRLGELMAELADVLGVEPETPLRPLHEPDLGRAPRGE